MSFRVCMFCGRDMGASEWRYSIAQISAAQGSTADEIPISVCASCNWYFDGDKTGMTPAMSALKQGAPGATYSISAGFHGSFRDLPKDKMLWYLASACKGVVKGSVSAWFTEIMHGISGGDITGV